MAGAVNAVIATKYDNTGLKKAQQAFGGLSKNLTKALGAVGIATSIVAITNSLQNAAKAATADAKSQALLANQLRNTVGANDQMIAGVEESINAMSRSAAVADDAIRPAFAQLVRATGDVGQATKLTSLALDVSAGTGKDLASVTTALGKAYQGNTGALAKLGINVKGMKDPLTELQTQFKGAAETAANIDPFQRMTIALGEIQETVGRAVMPAFQMLADWVTENEGTIGGVFESLGTVVQAILPILQPLLDLLIPIMNVIGELVEAVMPPLVAIFQALMPAIQPILDLFMVLVQAILPPLLVLLEKVLLPVLNFLVDILVNYLIPYWTKLAEIFGGILTVAVDSIVKGFEFLSKILKPIWEGVLKPIIEGFMSLMGIKPIKLSVSTTGASPDALERLASAKKKGIDLGAFGGQITGAQAKGKKAPKSEAEKAREKAKKALDAFKEDLKGFATSVKDLGKVSEELGKFEQETVDAFASISKSVDEGLLKGTIGKKSGKALLDYVATEAKAFRAIAKQRDEIANKRSLVEALMADVKAAVVGFGNITNLLDSQTRQVEQTITKTVGGLTISTKRTIEEVVSANGIVGNLQGILAKTKTFANQLKELRKLGLDKNLYQQIVDAGVEAGSATAEAIIAGGAGTVTELNSLFAQLDATGQDIAETSATVMYNNGVAVAGGLVAGLKSQEQALIDAATTLANAFTTTYNSLIGNLQTPQMEAEQKKTITYTLGQLKNIDLGKVTGDATWKADAALAKKLIASPKYTAQTKVTITVNAGVGTNGKAVGQAIQAELNKYAKASSK